MLAYEHVGLCAEEVCQRAGFEHDAVVDPAARLSEADLVRIWLAALEISGDPLLGLHAGEFMSPRRNQILAMLAVSGRTVGDGLSSIIKYQAIITDPPVASLHEETARVTMRLLSDVPTEALPHQRECMLAGLQNLVNTMTLNRAVAEQVRFQHRLRGGMDDYERVFRCEVFFDQPDTAIVFSRETWEMKLEVWDPFLRSRLESLAIEVQARGEQPGFISSVSRALEELLAHGASDLAAVAKRMRVSERTLQRRLHEEGTQFREVLDATRHAIVESAKGREIDEDEVARLAGFASIRALRRAIHRWSEPSDG